MKKINSIVALMTVLVLCLALLTGCGGDTASGSGSATDQTGGGSTTGQSSGSSTTGQSSGTGTTGQAPGSGAGETSGSGEEDSGSSVPAGEGTYVFEFEDLTFDGRKGAGLSGASNGKAMILCGNSDDLEIPEDFQPSNDYYVSYTYSVNAYEFEIDSSAETDAAIVLRLNSEIGAVKYDKNAFAIEVNGEVLDYKPITIYPIPNTSGVTDSHYFADYTLSVKAHLKAGANTITVRTLENTLLNGTNFAAPQLDCMKLIPDAEGTVLTFTNRVEGNY